MLLPKEDPAKHPLDFMGRPIHTGDVLVWPTLDLEGAIVMVEARVCERALRGGVWMLRVLPERVGDQSGGGTHWLENPAEGVLVVCAHRGPEHGYVESSADEPASRIVVDHWLRSA